MNSLSPEDVHAIQVAAAREQVDQALQPVAEYHENWIARQQQKQSC